MKKKVKKVQAEIVDSEVVNIKLKEEAPSPDLANFESVPLEAKDKSLAISDPVTQYIQELKKYPLLTREQEKELAIRYYETKDPEAAQRLVTSNLRFVVKVAAEYAKFGSKLIDLIQEGNIGLLHAVKEFNPYKGVRLISYAVWWIRGYIQEYLMKQYSLVKIGTTQTQKKLFYQLQKDKEALDKMVETGDYSQVSNQLGIDPEEIQKMAERLSGRDLSLSVQLDGGDSSTSYLDLQKSEGLPPDEILAQAEEIDILRSKVDSLKKNLNPKELILLEERLLADEPLTLQEIADRYGITREAVRQTESRLIAKLRQKFQEES